MPASLPQISGRDGVKAFAKIGCVFVCQRGSHIMLRGGGGAGLTVPDHRTLAPGTLRALIRDAGLTLDEFLALL